MLYRILRSQSVRNRIPRLVKVLFAENRVLLYPVKRRSPLQNIFHCCVHKTGSQWIRRILVDPRVYQYTGLRNQTRNVEVARASYATVARLSHKKKYIPNRIVSPLYIGFDGFRSLPKPERYRAFFVMRDPRDIVVSWYFSTAFSHPKTVKLQDRRSRITELSKEEGLIFSIEHLADYGQFDAMSSWIGAEAIDPNVKLVRFEDLIDSTDSKVFQEVFEHCDILVPEDELKHLLQEYSFERMSGRRPGQEDPESKYRKGTPGDWKNHFTDRVVSKFDEVTGDLAGRLGY